MNLLTLGVETSGMIGTVALRRAGQTIESVSLQQAGRRHAQTLIAEVDAMLRRAGVSSQQLNAVAVSIGPGSFTGLRVGVVFAKTLAYAIGCRLVAVDTFRAIAAASPANVSEVFVVSDAQRGDLFVGRYALGDSTSGPTRIGEIAIESSIDFCQRVQQVANSRTNIAISGPAAATVQSALPLTVQVLGSDLHSPKADFVAELGERQALAGEFSDPWQLEPFYLRRSAAEEKADS
ncbi:MAG: tRNA (adenosine(37)-N6)-threonylcarbamoyltransferase complex dimerization subunit type 1 TsaB [Planctomycetota bacterium]|nr:MAG: tRNA (adenosine(37)-N6)-threonylcarbamoyltransferase complex dimerization subunit type 1 TsaB [Planctomycetota bacterium]GDY10298.1 tRNA (adenosine(37)-N6)-threonylcarbamoyltransferase complex dimerization subunit type 1 TsaB [Planctomycetia bacterium]